MTKLIFGCGYLGERVAQRWRRAGDEVVVVTRSQDRADQFHRQDYRAIVADVTRPESLAGLPVAATVLYAVGFDRNSDRSIQDVYAGGLRNVVSKLPEETGRFIYISTTGVYGSADGGWVDETTPTDPQREGGRASLAAEKVFAESPLGSRSVVLRMAGIYGPGRIPFIRELSEGQPIAAPESGWLNLIHVDDAVQVILAAVALGAFDDGPRVYCVSDGRPVERGEFYREVARQIDAPSPRFVAPDPDSPRALRAEANRRVSNARVLADLKVVLTYPDYRAGIANAVETQNQL